MSQVEVNQNKDSKGMHFPAYKIKNKHLKLYMLKATSDEERKIWSEIADSQSKNHKRKSN